MLEMEWEVFGSGEAFLSWLYRTLYSWLPQLWYIMVLQNHRYDVIYEILVLSKKRTIPYTVTVHRPGNELRYAGKSGQ
jgi:hypothetical protein